MKKKILSLICLLIVSCTATDEPRSARILKSQGYTEIRWTGYEYWSCSKDDGYKTGFIAKAPHGETVKGAVCCGRWGKNCTVRLE